LIRNVKGTLRCAFFFFNYLPILMVHGMPHKVALSLLCVSCFGALVASTSKPTTNNYMHETLLCQNECHLCNVGAPFTTTGDKLLLCAIEQ